MVSQATPEGTLRFARRMADRAAPGHFRSGPAAARAEDSLHLSSIGMGSYTGPADEDGDRQYREAVVEAVLSGVNVIDCSINYRHMRSERSLGQGLRSLFETGQASRDEVFVMTKGGYFPFEGTVPSDVGRYLRRTYLDPGIVQPDEVVSGSHCIAPRFLDDQLSRSLSNFGLEAVDVYFLHNVEQQLDEVSPEDFLRRVRDAFVFLEQAVRDHRIGCYGTATWNGFRVPGDARDHLSLEKLVQTAAQVAGTGHHFRVIQLPYNLGMSEALSKPTQELQGKSATILEAAAALGIMVVTSVPLLQTQVLPHVPERFTERMPGLTTSAQRALQFVRSTPGVFSALVGMKSLAHVRENAVVVSVDPLDRPGFLKLLAD
jgi:aryl-alcohol dehydrogenase-like predicted oxidoreductase